MERVSAPERELDALSVGDAELVAVCVAPLTVGFDEADVVATAEREPLRPLVIVCVCEPLVDAEVEPESVAVPESVSEPVGEPDAAAETDATDALAVADAMDAVAAAEPEAATAVPVMDVVKESE